MGSIVLIWIWNIISSTLYQPWISVDHSVIYLKTNVGQIFSHRQVDSDCEKPGISVINENLMLCRTANLPINRTSWLIQFDWLIRQLPHGAQMRFAAWSCFLKRRGNLSLCGKQKHFKKKANIQKGGGKRGCNQRLSFSKCYKAPRERNKGDGYSNKQGTVTLSFPIITFKWSS